MSDWLARIDASRTELIAAATGSRISAAFAMAEARIQLIESLSDENIKARLLRMTDPRIGMVELANNPTDEDRIRVCAIAILSGFCPGDDQFAVFGGKGGGKLYTKEAGFRTLFAHLGIVPEVSVGHPEFVPLGKSGKKLWRVDGKASCSYQGKVYTVEFAGAMSLGLPGYETDNVAGITAKARRQILKSLWTKVSPILNDDHADEVEVLPQSEPAAIEKKPSEEPTQLRLDRDRNVITSQFDRCRIMIANEETHLKFFNESVAELEAATSLETIAIIRDAMNITRKGLKLSEAVSRELKRFVDLRIEELGGTP